MLFAKKHSLVKNGEVGLNVMYMKKKLKKYLLFFTWLCCIIAMWSFGINAYVKSSVRNQIITLDDATYPEDVDCIVVLGCLVKADGSPSGMLRDRLDTALMLWNRGVSDTLLMSGDHGTKEYDEVNAMRNFAVAQGVPIERIFMDHAGFCTYDSIYRLKEIFGAKKVVIVTQEYHLYRALYIAKSMGLDAHGVISDLNSYYGQTSRDIREYIARNKDFLWCVFKPEPKYLGNAIDLNGDGRITEG